LLLLLLVLRPVLKKRYGARLLVVIWTLIALRLLIPVSVPLPQEMAFVPLPARWETSYTWDTVNDPGPAQPDAPLPDVEPRGDGKVTTQLWPPMAILTAVWMGGMVLFFLVQA